jgi:hypothetical protein
VGNPAGYISIHHRKELEMSEPTDSKNQVDRDPQDLQFGKSAAEDETRVDELDERGVSEGQMPDHPQEAPRAGNKAKPHGDS